MVYGRYHYLVVGSEHYFYFSIYWKLVFIVVFINQQTSHLEGATLGVLIACNVVPPNYVSWFLNPMKTSSLYLP